MANKPNPVSKKEITLTQLKYFISAAIHRSMTGAAAELYIAQSAVSTSIAQLEKTLGVQLFIRQPSKGLVLTSNGEQFFHDARALLAQLDALTENVRSRDQAIEGVLRLACFVTLAPFILPKLISTIRDRHPDLRVEVFEADFDEITKMLRDGTVEAALTYDYGPSQGVFFDQLYRAEPHIILPASHQLANEESLALSALDNWDFILLDMPHSREYFLGLFASVGVEVHIRHTSRSYETVRSLVARGHGFSILNNIPKSAYTYDGGQLSAVQITDSIPPLEVSFAHATDIRPSARARAMAEIAAEILQQEEIQNLP